MTVPSPLGDPLGHRRRARTRSRLHAGTTMVSARGRSKKMNSEVVVAFSSSCVFVLHMATEQAVYGYATVYFRRPAGGTNSRRGGSWLRARWLNFKQAVFKTLFNTNFVLTKLLLKRVNKKRN